MSEHAGMFRRPDRGNPRTVATPIPPPRLGTAFSLLQVRRLLALILAVLAPAGLARAAEPVGSGSRPPAGDQLQVPLEWQESSEPFQTCALRFSTATQTFLKEPDFGRHRVLRGAWSCGVRTNEFIAFAWDQTANRLYLDRNGNRDLTDDADSPYAGEYDGPHQLFPGVKLQLNTPSGHHRYLVDLRLSGTAAPQLQGTCAVRSLWQSRVVLAGNQYQIGLVENPDAKAVSDETPYLLFRSWDSRTEPIRLNPGTPFLISWSPRVYLAGRGFNVSSRYTNQAGSDRYVIDLTPTEPVLGELRADRQHLYRLILSQPGGYVVVLDRPGPAEQIPVGTYQTGEVWLRQGGAEAFYLGSLPLTVRAKATVWLETGGPLTNVVAAERSGDHLVLSYRLASAGSRRLTYRLSSEDRSNPPAWTIRLGDTQLAAGKFEYG